MRERMGYGGKGGRYKNAKKGGKKERKELAVIAVEEKCGKNITTVYFLAVKCFRGPPLCIVTSARVISLLSFRAPPASLLSCS